MPNMIIKNYRLVVSAIFSPIVCCNFYDLVNSVIFEDCLGYEITMILLKNKIYFEVVICYNIIIFILSILTCIVIFGAIETYVNNIRKKKGAKKVTHIFNIPDHFFKEKKLYVLIVFIVYPVVFFFANRIIFMILRFLIGTSLEELYLFLEWIYSFF